MDATGSRLQRTLVHRHTPAGRRFWQEAAETLEDIPGDRAVMLVALAREARMGHGSIQAWIEAACPAALPATPRLAEALRRFSPPPMGPRSRRHERIGALVRRSLAEALPDTLVASLER